VSRAFFDDLEDALRGFLPPALTDFSARRTSRNLKVWYGDNGAEHYEVQLASGKLEIGWHAEHRDVSRNDEALARLTDAEKAWRKALGPGPVAGRFLGRFGPVWRRVSEVWDGPGLDGPETAIEAADRLATYIEALEKVRSAPRAARPRPRRSPSGTSRGADRTGGRRAPRP
jgi:hypothetical protein